MITPRLTSFFLLAISCAFPALAQTPADAAAAARVARHQSADWQVVEPHLPDPATASPTLLETAADVLRARRFPEEALDFYRAALSRGGDRAHLLVRIGITELELKNPGAARSAFRDAVAADNKSAEGWNNLGASEYALGNFPAAIFDYRKAVRLNKKAAIYHSNLGTAYFEQKDFEGARLQFTTAIKLDPEIFHHGGWGGVDAHVMSPQDRGHFCFEMATLAARTGNEESAILWLSRAAEAGENIHWNMQGLKEFAPYQHDQRVEMIIHNAKMLRTHQLAVATIIPTLPAPSPQQN